MELSFVSKKCINNSHVLPAETDYKNAFFSHDWSIQLFVEFYMAVDVTLLAVVLKTRAC
jgi:hypothetical protein